MYSRLGFSIAVHVDADIFLADEVLAVGDRPFKRKCLKKMQEIRAEGTTIFYVSHATASVRSMCDRVLVLEAGRLMYDSKTTPDGSVDGAIRFLHYDDETRRRGAGGRGARLRGLRTAIRKALTCIFGNAQNDSRCDSLITRL